MARVSRGSVRRVVEEPGIERVDDEQKRERLTRSSWINGERNSRCPKTSSC